MGAWGTGLYQDDVAEDIKDDYYGYFRNGLNNKEAYEKLISSYKETIADADDGPVFWFALADIMWDCGKLTQEVKEKACYYIDSGIDVEKWKLEDEKKATKRKQVLDNLKIKINSPMPREKKIGKKRVYVNKWQIGDMYVMPIQEQYPRFPKMQVKYLLLIKIGDKKDYKDNIQPVVYIKYLTEPYHEGIDINELEFAELYEYGYRFIICGIAGRPLPKEFTYVGNYGELSKLERPNEEEEKIEKLGFLSENSVKSLEYICISGYLMNSLGIPASEFVNTIYMTERECQDYISEKKKKEIESEIKRNAERKRKEFYICPWKDGDTFYLPLREETEDGKKLMEMGYVGVVLVKIGTKEDYATTNQWPVMIMRGVKVKYDNVEGVLDDKVINFNEIYSKSVIMLKKHEKIPEKLQYLGNIEDYEKVQMKDRLPFNWNGIEWEIATFKIYN